MKNTEGFALRLPPDLKLFVLKQAQRNGSSQNSEVIRAIRERMERLSENKRTDLAVATPSRS